MSLPRDFICRSADTTTDDASLSRRTLLASGATLAALAGCLGSSDEDNASNATTTNDTNDSTNTTDPNATPTNDTTDNATPTAPGDPDDPDSPGDSNGETETPPQSTVASLETASIATTPQVGPTEGLRTSATITNSGTESGAVTVTITLTPEGTADPVATTDQTRTLAPDERATLELTGTDSAALGRAIAEAGPGTYTLEARGATNTASQSLVVQQPATPALSELSLGTDTITTATTTPLQPTVTLANTGALSGTFTVRARLEASEDGEDSPGSEDSSSEADASLPRETSVDQLVTPGDQARLTLPLDVSGLDRGTYPLTVTAAPAENDAPAEGDTPADSDRQARVSTSLTVEQAPGELTVTVYTQTDSDEHRATSGTLRVVPVGGSGTDTASDPDPVATHDLGDGATVTLSDGVANDRQYRLETVDLNDGVYPDGQQTVTVDGQTDVEFVAAYEFQGADSFRTSVYLFAQNGTSIMASENYYGWATHAADDDHYVRYHRIPASSRYEFGKQIHDHGAGFRQFRAGSTTFDPVEQVRLDGEAYGHRYGEVPSDWEALENDAAAFDPKSTSRKNTGTLIPTRPLTSFTGGRPEKQQFAGEVTIDGQTLHQYNVSVENYPTSRAFVDPETGYTMRWETEKSYSGEDELGYEIQTYSDHGEIPTLSVSSIDFVNSPPPQL